MTAPMPTIDVLRNDRVGTILIRHYAVQRSVGWAIGWGPPEVFTLDQFRSVGLAVILKSLDEFADRDGEDESKHFRLSKPQQAKFLRDHKTVNVSLKGPQLMLLTPMRREGSGLTGLASLELKLPADPNDFYARLEIAFGSCRWRSASAAPRIVVADLTHGLRGRDET